MATKLRGSTAKLETIVASRRTGVRILRENMGLDEEKALLGSTVVLEKVKKVSKYSPFIKNDKYLTKRGIQRLFKRGYPTTTVA